LWAVDWSADGKFFAVAGDWNGVFDTKTFQRVSAPALDAGSRLNGLHWHPQRNALAVSGTTGDATSIYDLAADRKIPLQTKEGARGMAWNANGDRVAASANDGSLQIWNATGELLKTTRPEKAKGVTGVAWHPRGEKIITVGEFINVHDGDGALIAQLKHRREAKGFCLLLCVAWHPSGEFFVVGDYGNHDTGDWPALQFWSSEGQLLKSVEVDVAVAIRGLDWNADGSLLASASDALRLWSKDGELRHTGKSPDALWGVSWNREGDAILTSSIEGRVTLWTPTAEVARRIVEVREQEPVATGAK
jgi:WD40 repeat protein